jgi:hypothetical protein
MSRASIRRATKASSLGGLMRQAAQRRHLWEVFSDFCEMAALSIANAVDLAQREPREARYMAIVKRYTPDELALFPQMLAALVDQMETGGPADVLGALFGELELGNADRGQFFTPYEVCRLMAGMNVDGPTLKRQVEEQGFVTVMEPACGAGAMIIAMSEAMREAGVEPQRHMHVTCQDVDSRGVHMCYLQLSLLHIPAAVVLGNTLALECREVWYTPAHILGGWSYKLRQRHRNPMLDVANDNPPAAAPPPPEPAPEVEAVCQAAETPPAAAPAAPPPPPTEQLGLF